MRATTKQILISAILSIFSAATARAQGALPASNSNTVQISIVVPSIVRVVAVPGENGGAPQVKVISNDPRFRDVAAAPVRPETVAPQGIAYEPAGHGRGGASALAAEVVAGPTTYRYTVALP